MLETALKGSKKYWIFILWLIILIGIGLVYYVRQLEVGLCITGLSRDVSWGFYQAQFVFLVGVAAGGVMIVLPYYLHDYKKFGRITILGEFLAVSAMIMCFLFLLVHLGQPLRCLNILLHPTLQSMMFWDGTILAGYLILNIIIGWVVLEAERNSVPSPSWTKPLIYISIPFAFGIHTLTAFIYCGLPGRGFWLTAILAPRFLASAFAAGPAFLILLCFLIRKVSTFDPGKEAIQAISKIVTYALITNMFFFLCEIFVVFYSRIPEHMAHFKYLYVGQGVWVPWMWASGVLLIIALILLIIPVTRKNEITLGIACIALFVGIWIDKGLGLISGGFIPSPLHHITEYIPTMPEILISVGVYGVGFLVLTILYKITVSVKEEVGA